MRAEVDLTSYWATHHPQISFYSMHPGWCHTPGVQKSLPGFFSAMESRLRTPEQGADTIVWAAVSAKVLDIPKGSFLFGTLLLMLDRHAVSPHITGGGTLSSSSEDNVNSLVGALKAYLPK